MICPVDECLDPPEISGLSWCVVDIGYDNGFRVPQSSDAHMHFVIEGAVRITSMSGQSLDLAAGDVAVQISGDFHKLHCGESRTNPALEELANNVPADTPLFAEVGDGPHACRLLSGRLKVAWPANGHPAQCADTLLLRKGDIAIDVPRLFGTTTGAGATAVLNRAASLLLAGALRKYLSCPTSPGREAPNPIVRARGLIERHPFATWSVDALAARVGMARSSFAARFVAETGKTPIVALKEERMKHAMLFVRNTNLEIGEVSEKVGYQSEAAFVRQFAKHFRITPSKLRKQPPYRVQ